MKKISKILLFIAVLFVINNPARAEDAQVNLTIRSGNTIIFTGNIPLKPSGTIELNGHSLDADSVLAVLNDADTGDDSWSISDLQYYDSFGSFYLKCITSSAGNNCDNWQYTVNDSYPSASINQKILSGGENVYVYFGPQYKVTLSANEINTADNLTVTAQEYDYQDNNWKTRTTGTVGLTQPNPDDSFSPLEILTLPLARSGQAVFTKIPAGTYNVGIKEDFYFPTEPLTVTDVPAPEPSASFQLSNGGGGESIIALNPIKSAFDLEKAFDFIISQQKDNGSFGEDLYTDWIAITLASGNYQVQTIKLIKYLEGLKIENANLTDYERHVMALMALGLNPYNTNEENYIEKIIESFDRKQFGDKNEDNDDIFALIVLQNAGYRENDKMINDDISFVLSRQKEDGSWDESIDMTGAGMEAFYVFSGDEKVKNALLKAKDFLKQNQKENGGWNDSASSTAWALEGIMSLGEKVEDWRIGTNNPLDYLTALQDADGGIKDTDLNNRIWETAYVVGALSEKTWNQTMQEFEKPIVSSVVKTQNKPAQKQTAKIITVVKKKDIKPKLENLADQNTATAINATSSPASETKTETPQKSWFVKLIDKIFSIF